MSKADVQVVLVRSQGRNEEGVCSQDDKNDSVREQIAEVIREILSIACGSDVNLLVDWMKGDRTTVYKITIEQRALGRLLGAKGSHINGLRSIVNAMSGNHGFRAIIESPHTFEYGALTPKSRD